MFACPCTERASGRQALHRGRASGRPTASLPSGPGLLELVFAARADGALAVAVTAHTAHTAPSAAASPAPPTPAARTARGPEPRAAPLSPGRPRLLCGPRGPPAPPRERSARSPRQGCPARACSLARGAQSPAPGRPVRRAAAPSSRPLPTRRPSRCVCVIAPRHHRSPGEDGGSRS